MADVYRGGEDQRLPDAAWIRRADRESWVAITKDSALLRDHLDVLNGTTLRLFVVPNANLTGVEIVRRLNHNWEAILRRAATDGPYGYAILPNGLQRRWP